MYYGDRSKNGKNWYIVVKDIMLVDWVSDTV